MLSNEYTIRMWFPRLKYFQTILEFALKTHARLNLLHNHAEFVKQNFQNENYNYGTRV